jgi:hypothetical protein
VWVIKVQGVAEDPTRTATVRFMELVASLVRVVYASRGEPTTVRYVVGLIRRNILRKISMWDEVIISINFFRVLSGRRLLSALMDAMRIVFKIHRLRRND